MIEKVSSPQFHSSQAFEGVKRSPGPIFSSTGVIDKIRNSKYFQALLEPSKEKDCDQLVNVDQLGKQNKTGSEASQVFFGNGSKNNNSEGCIIIERPQSHGIQTQGPGVSYVKSPSCEEEVIPDVSARGKLVTPEISRELSDSRNRGEKEKEDESC
ncbi:uncharacterized protein LOC123898078 isoform X1 [Trifolium pratense]|uniref:uncharacterized protein LOC123898078 isoform X1 n=1 Tax=Trifolium pratense TaxID=57577 RepID=UPI001E69640C|nr:uncharacterized protein LOC123898078 isoform X1 [Trifolium pratense]XP_045804887.1 uncharacterized protein LOC123898078 isoform X1 [Trifolium pratense]XP_045804888.1 uncharacterized protein LOC123898078 isoform X1 [Trifolium pratense]